MSSTARCSRLLDASPMDGPRECAQAKSLYKAGAEWAVVHSDSPRLNASSGQLYSTEPKLANCFATITRQRSTSASAYLSQGLAAALACRHCYSQRPAPSPALLPTSSPAGRRTTHNASPSSWFHVSQEPETKEHTRNFAAGSPIAGLIIAD